MKKAQFFVILLTLFLITLLGFSSIGMTQMGTWTRKTDMPVPTTWLATCVLDGKIYAIGGWNSSELNLSNVYEYAPATDTWTQKANMPTARDSLCASVVNGKIYAISGLIEGTGPFLRTVEEYNPSTNTWMKKADIPTARQEFATTVVDGKIYAIGGNNPTFLNTVEEYDPVEDTWTRKANMPTPRSWLDETAPVVNGKIYVIGGFIVTHGSSSPVVEEYDPSTNTWTRKADMLTARGAMGVSEVGGKIYAIGGSGNGGVSSIVEVYDPATDSWTRETDMPTKRMYCLPVP